MYLVLAFKHGKEYHDLIKKEFDKGISLLNKVRLDLNNENITTSHIILPYKRCNEKELECQYWYVDIVVTEEDCLKMIGDYFIDKQKEEIVVYGDDYVFNKYVSLDYKVYYKRKFLFFKKIDTIHPVIKIDKKQILEDWISDGCLRNYNI